MTLKEAHILTLRVLKQVMEEKLDQHNVQLAQVRILSPHDRLENVNLIAPLFFFPLSGDAGKWLRDPGRSAPKSNHRGNVTTRYEYVVLLIDTFVQYPAFLSHSFCAQMTGKGNIAYNTRLNSSSKAQGSWPCAL